MKNERTPSSWLTIRFLGLSALVWLLVAGVIEWILLRHLNTRWHDWHKFLLNYLVVFGPYVLATPLLFEAARRLAPARYSAWRYVLQLAGLVWLFSITHGAIAFASAPSQHGRILFVMLPRLFAYGVILATGVSVNLFQLAEARRHDLLAAQLAALRSQLQPHFLFNTLQAIAVTTRRDPEAAIGMLTLLGDLLRQTLRQRDSQLVPLSEEHALLQPYLELQQLRFADRLRVEVDLPADLLGAAVPDLILQPLVENALQHGIESTPGAGRIRIRARRVGDTLELQVADDGAGVGPDRHDVTDGIGLGATRGRLEALFGDRAALELDTSALRGTLVTVRLPWQETQRAV